MESCVPRLAAQGEREDGVTRRRACAEGITDFELDDVELNVDLCRPEINRQLEKH
jgi:hypothetical protein